MEPGDMVSIPSSEYETLLDIKRESALLKYKINRLEKDLTFHSITSANHENIRDFNEKQREEYYIYNVLLLKNCPGNLFFFDLKLNFVLGSEMGLNTMKHTSASITQVMPFNNLFNRAFCESDIDFIKKHCILSLSKRESLYKTHDFVCVDGREIKMRIEVSPAMDELDVCHGVTLVMHDITEISNEREKAVQASKAKSIFLASMSHDIRTPMNAIIGMSEILLNEPLTKRQESYVHDILTSSTSLLGLINDILDLSKIEDGKLEIIPVEYNLPLMIENINSMFRHSAGQKDLKYNTTQRTAIPDYIIGDDIRVRQILTNIIGNAIKFTLEGSVSFDIYVDDNMLCFDISDTGTGIREEDIPNLFRPFSQLNEEKHRYIQGSGLGLSITQNLVQMMNGTLTVDSIYGKGSTFRVRLPLKVCDSGVIARKSKPKTFKYIQAPGADVLVVDDNLVNLKVAVSMLKLCGIEADTVTSGRQAIEKIAEKQYDIVFLDHMMPEMDGIQTALELRKIGYHPDDLTIIALSANAFDGARKLFLDSGMQDFLVKPIDKNLLNDILIRWLPSEKIASASSKLADIKKTQIISGVDIDYAMKNVNGGPEAIIKNLTVLRKNIPMILAALETENIEITKIASVTHGLCVLLGNAGIPELLETVTAIRENAQNKDAARCRELLPSLVSDLKKLSLECAHVLGPDED